MSKAGQSGNIPRYEQQGFATTCRSYEEYLRMFAISREDLAEGPLLDVAAGASSFVADANEQGIEAIAVDPMYDQEPEEMQRKGLVEIDEATEKIGRLRDYWDWAYYGDLVRYRSIRFKSLERFIADYREYRGVHYVAALLPDLPFPDNHFKFVFCSHFLFLYGDRLDQNFHLQAIREMLRVCRKDGRVLIYPLKTLKWDRFPGLGELIATLQAEGTKANFLPSQLPFIPGSTELLSLSK